VYPLELLENLTITKGKEINHSFNFIRELINESFEGPITNVKAAPTLILGENWYICSLKLKEFFEENDWKVLKGKIGSYSHFF